MRARSDVCGALRRQRDVFLFVFCNLCLLTQSDTAPEIILSNDPPLRARQIRASTKSQRLCPDAGRGPRSQWRERKVLWERPRECQAVIKPREVNQQTTQRGSNRSQRSHQAANPSRRGPKEGQPKAKGVTKRQSPPELERAKLKPKVANHFKRGLKWVKPTLKESPSGRGPRQSQTKAKGIIGRQIPLGEGPGGDQIEAELPSSRC